MKLFNLITLIFFFSFYFHSQPTLQGFYNFKNYSTDHGLPSSETYDIEQDNEGNIWIATDRGVVKYDSRTFKVYTKKDGLIDDVVFQIYKDPYGKLWFLSFKNKLCYYQNGKIIKYKYNDRILKLIPKSVQSDKDIVVKKNGDLILSIVPFGAIEIDKYGKSKRVLTKKQSLLLRVIENKLIWSMNLRQINIEAPRPDIYFCDRKKSNFVIKENNPEYKIQTTGDIENQYLLINNKIYDFKTRKTITEFPKNTIISILKDGENLLVGTLKNGVIQGSIKKNNFSIINNFLKNYSITNVFKDRDNGYWFSTLEAGVYFLPSIELINFSKKQNLLDYEVKSVFGLNNNIFIGYLGSNFQTITKSKIINHFEKGRACTTFSKIENDLIYSNSNGTFLKNKKLSIECIKDFYQISDGCIGVREQIIKFHKGGQKVLSNWNIDKRTSFQAILQDENNKILLGNRDGLHKLVNRKIIPFRKKDFNHIITDLIYSKEWGKIIATRDAGIFIFQKNNFKKIKGLISKDVTTLFIDPTHKLWVGTNKGVNILEINNKNEIEINCITKNNGLISNEITSIFVDKKNAWVGTKKGLSKIYLKNLKINNKNNIIKLHSILLNNNKHVNILKKIIIPYYNDVIKIKFGTINFITKGKYKYRFNNNKNWNYVKDTEILLFNPEDGKYNLEVAFLNENNKWSNTQKIAQFEIQPPFWKTIYFKIIVLLCITGLIYLFVRFKKNQFETKQKLILLEQKALFAQMNPHFIFNTLNSIKSFLIYNENDKAEYFLSKFSKLLRQTLHVSRNNSIAIQKEVDLLEKYLELEQMRFSNKFQWTIFHNLSEDELDLKIPNMLIQPSLENSIKHGFIEKRFDYKIQMNISLIGNDILICEIIDNGIGRKASFERKAVYSRKNEHKSYGEKITKERLKTYNKFQKNKFGTVILDEYDEYGNSCGTKSILTIPIIQS